MATVLSRLQTVELAKAYTKYFERNFYSAH